MSFDAGLAERVREIVSDTTEIAEKRMFGGIATHQDKDLATWVERGLKFVRTLPNK